MGKVISLGTSRTGSRGTVHVWPARDGGYEIGHESASGNSWGQFDQFDGAAEAVAAAHRVNRDVYAGQCDVYIGEEVIAALPRSPSPTRGKF